MIVINKLCWLYIYLNWILIFCVVRWRYFGTNIPTDYAHLKSWLKLNPHMLVLADQTEPSNFTNLLSRIKKSCSTNMKMNVRWKSTCVFENEAFDIIKRINLLLKNKCTHETLWNWCTRVLFNQSEWWWWCMEAPRIAF